MTTFDPVWGGLDYVQDTAPYDGMGISFLPSVVNDALAAQSQTDSEASVRSFMQAQYRAAAENLMETGLIFAGGA